MFVEWNSSNNLGRHKKIKVGGGGGADRDSTIETGVMGVGEGSVCVHQCKTWEGGMTHKPSSTLCKQLVWS